MVKEFRNYDENFEIFLIATCKTKTLRALNFFQFLCIELAPIRALYRKQRYQCRA